MREDWVECKIGEVLKIERGGSPRPIKEFITKRADGINWIKIGDTDKDSKYITSTEDKIKIEGLKKTRIVEPGDFVLSNSMSFGRPFIMGIKGAIHDGWLALRNSNCVFDTDFLYYSLSSPNIYGQFNKLATGSTVRNLNSELVAKVVVSIPPLLEQRAIVKKIESLFSNLDAGVSDLKKAQQQLKIYRQAVLKKVFEGIVATKTIIDIANVNTGSTPKRGTDRYWKDGEFPWITSGALNELFVTEAEEFITQIALKETNCKIIPIGSLLIAMYGEGKTRGKCSELKINAATNQAIACISIKDEFLYSKNYVKWFLIKNYQDIRLLSNGGVQPNLNLSIIKNTVIPFPDEKEQHQIIKEIESRLSVCDSVEKNIKESLLKAEALRQSILKKAFEGNLLTAQELAECKQAANYEPASLLLERIKAEQNNLIAKPNKKKTIEPLVVAKQELPIIKVSADLHAGLIAKVITIHEKNPALIENLSHIKCEKIAHLVEYHLHIPLGRQPVKDAAGPDDYPHLKKIEHRARMANYFVIQEKPIGYSYSSGKNSDKAIDKLQAAISAEKNKQLDDLISLFQNFDLEVAEIIATTYAGWNNLIINGNVNPSDEDIVFESRENWSERKLTIVRERFFKAINWMRKNELVPTGYGAIVPFPKKKK